MEETKLVLNVAYGRSNWFAKFYFKRSKVKVIYEGQRISKLQENDAYLIIVAAVARSLCTAVAIAAR